MRKSILLLMVCLLVFVLGACSEEAKPNKSVSFQEYNDYAITYSGNDTAYGFEYEDIDKIDQFSDDIVTAEVVELGKKIDYDFGDGDIASYTRTKVKIVETHKGELKEGDIIDVAEPSYFDEETKEYYLFDGYNIMQEGTQYLLFLKEYTKEDGYQDSGYMTTGVHLGKYDLGKNKAQEVTSELTTFQEISDSEYIGHDIDKFNQFKKEALEKYID